MISKTYIEERITELEQMSYLINKYNFPTDEYKRGLVNGQIQAYESMLSVVKNEIEARTATNNTESIAEYSQA